MGNRKKVSSVGSFKCCFLPCLPQAGRQAGRQAGGERPTMAVEDTFSHFPSPISQFPATNATKKDRSCPVLFFLSRFFLFDAEKKRRSNRSLSFLILRHLFSRVIFSSSLYSLRATGTLWLVRHQLIGRADGRVAERTPTL